MPPPAPGLAGSATTPLVPAAADGGGHVLPCLGDTPGLDGFAGLGEVCLGEVPPTVAPEGELSPAPNLPKMGCKMGPSQRKGLREPSCRFELGGGDEGAVPCRYARPAAASAAPGGSFGWALLGSAPALTACELGGPARPCGAETCETCFVGLAATALPAVPPDLGAGVAPSRGEAALGGASTTISLSTHSATQSREQREERGNTRGARLAMLANQSDS